MNRSNGSTGAAPQGAVKDMGDLSRDMVSLAELQYELFQSDCRDGLKGLLFSVALLLAAGIVALGTVPIALVLMAELLVQAAGLSRAAGFSIAALTGVVVAVALGVVGWSRVRTVGFVFARSRREMARNMAWIKDALSRKEPKASEQLHDR